MHNNKKITSILSDKVQVRVSGIHGKGMFAICRIVAGEMVCIKGGYILRRDKMFYSKSINSYLPISDELCIASNSLELEDGIKLYFNHSCNPNCGMHGEITFVAMRDIDEGEELTIDYAFVDNDDYAFECHCGDPNCRKIITGYDWKRQELQEKYYPYFAQYLKDKIEAEKRK